MKTEFGEGTRSLNSGEFRSRVLNRRAEIRGSSRERGGEYSTVRERERDKVCEIFNEL